MDANLIILLILLVAGIAAYIYFRKQKGKNQVRVDKAATAQEFINVKDVGDKVLYTIDGNVFCYVQISGICPELFTDNEINSMYRRLASDLSKIRQPWKFISVPRPLDLRQTLREYSNIYATAEQGRRILLKQEMNELAEMTDRGDTLERRYYIILYGSVKNEKTVKNAAEDMAKIFVENGAKAEVLEGKDIVKLCSLVNIPAYSHLENNYDLEDTMLEAMIKE